MKFKHFISSSCAGEYCTHETLLGICGKAATHKVGEEIPNDYPANDENLPITIRLHIQRHNFTAYVCCEHFGAIFGGLAKTFCEAE